MAITNSHKMIHPNLKQTPIPVSQVNSDTACAAPFITPSADQDPLVSDAIHDPQPLTNPTPGSGVVDPSPPASSHQHDT